MTLDQALQTFTLESRELLQEMEDALLHDSTGEVTADSVNAVFRAAHTIKGSAGLFGLDHIVAFTHVAESVLDLVRAGRIALDRELVSLLLGCRDHVGQLVDAVAAGMLDEDPVLTEQGRPLIERLQVYLGASGDAAASAAAAAPANAAQQGQGHWHISLRFGAEVLRNGMDPMSFLRYLGTLGEVTHVAPVLERLPMLDGLDPEACHLGFEIAFRSEASQSAIEDAFEFVRDDCRIRIIPPRSIPAAHEALLQEFPEERAAFLPLLTQCGCLPAAAESTPAEHAGLLPAAAPAAAPLAAVDTEAADGGAAKRSREGKAERSTIRVDAERLDHLINLVGELIVATSSANLAARRARNVELEECGSTLSALVEEVRNSALQLRMVKIGATFNRFRRVVHDVASDLGKEIDLVIGGEDTELDKTVIEKIADPLTHLVRNAIDHGIEPAQLRLERGKPARGTVRMNAYHDSGTIVITVSDDGGGLQRERILAKAVQRGIVEEGKHLSDEDIFALIFEPGFSTAEQVTNLSGRGVGMDVVKRNINALRGNIQLSSTPGLGTTFTVRLPLTLAIIDGFQIGVGRSVFVIPLEMVDECIEFNAESGHDYCNLRGAVLPFIRLDQLFGIEARPGARQSLVVVRYAGQRLGLVVDSLLGEAQTVIKPLGKLFQHMHCISGSSILGSGEVALILDVPALARQAGGHEAPRQSLRNDADIS